MPLGSVYWVRSKRPSVAVARYGAIGEVFRHTNVVSPPAVEVALVLAPNGGRKLAQTS